MELGRNLVYSDLNSSKYAGIWCNLCLWKEGLVYAMQSSAVTSTVAACDTSAWVVRFPSPTSNFFYSHFLPLPNSRMLRIVILTILSWSAFAQQMQLATNYSGPGLYVFFMVHAELSLTRSFGLQLQFVELQSRKRCHRLLGWSCKWRRVNRKLSPEVINFDNFPLIA